MKLGQFKIAGMEQRDHTGPIAYINQKLSNSIHSSCVRDCNTEEQIWKWNLFNFQSCGQSVLQMMLGK
jgi:hypothetical protein